MSLRLCATGDISSSVRDDGIDVTPPPNALLPLDMVLQAECAAASRHDRPCENHEARDVHGEVEPVATTG